LASFRYFLIAETTGGGGAGRYKFWFPRIASFCSFLISKSRRREGEGGAGRRRAVVMATADWQEAVQASFLGLMFAFMVAKLVSLVFSFWGKNLRLECAPVSAAALSFTTVDDGELTPADEFNAPLASWPAGEEAAAAEEEEEEEEEELSGGEGHDKQHDRDFDDASSGEDTIETYHHHLHSSFSDSTTDTPVPAARVEEAVFRPDESGKLNEEEKVATDVDFKEDLKPLKLSAIDTVATVSEEHPLQALTEGQKEERIKKGIEEEEEQNETDDWEGVESSELEEQFGAASTYVASMVTLPGVKPSSEAMLQLYAYYKIATEGPCSTSQPSILQPTARAKW
jgi:hypothetical protein